MLVLLIRHGESRANVEGIIQGTDDPLTSHGRRQAEALARTLAERYRIDALYTSPLQRAADTAEIIGNRIGRSPVAVAGLAEIDAGVAAGRTWREWRAEDPARALRWTWERRSATDGWEGGEDGAAFSARVFTAFDQIIARHAISDDTIAIVTHGGVLSWLAACHHGDPLDVWPARRAGFTNCSISELHVAADGSRSIGAWNLGCDVVDEA